MARLVFLACLLLSVVSGSVLVVEQCSTDCSKHCGTPSRYITDKCIDESTGTGSYMATCTPSGKWKVEFYGEKICKGSKKDLGGEDACHLFPKKTPVKYVSFTKDSNQVTIKVCDSVDTAQPDNCDDSTTCHEHTISTTTSCGDDKVADKYYSAKVTDPDGAATLTLGLFQNKDQCTNTVAPVFYKEGMAKEACASYNSAFKATCTAATATVVPDNNGGTSSENNGGNSSENNGGNSSENNGGNSSDNNGDNNGGNSSDNNGGNNGGNSSDNNGGNNGGDDTTTTVANDTNNDTALSAASASVVTAVLSLLAVLIALQ